MTWPPSLPAVAVIVLVLVAAGYDLRTRRVPNLLTFGAAAAALVLHGALGGWSALGSALLGWTAGVALFLPLYLLGGMGAGDAKLLGAVGAWLGPMSALWTGLYGAIAGGVMALAVAAWRGYTRTALSNVGTMLRIWRVAGVRPVAGLTLAEGNAIRLPYAVPLAAGALAALWLRL